MNLSMKLSRSIRHFSKTSSICSSCQTQVRRAASTQATTSHVDSKNDIESTTFSLPNLTDAEIKNFDPLKSSRERKTKLPSSRYRFRSPRYDRGPLHPHQPPPVTDPSSREFVPGPFSSPRLQQHYENVIAPDYMTLCYQHRPPGFRPIEKGPRLRPWIGDSPYFANRQLRGPRGGDVLRLLRKPITFRNLPKLEKITIHSFCKGVLQSGSSYLHVAGMVLQAITGKRVTVHKSKRSVPGFSLREDIPIACTVGLTGEEMYYFMDKLVNVVMPRIKDYRGVRATTGDSAGNIMFGFEPDVVGTFPEVEVNYDSYPPKMIPGLHVTIHTSARTDKDARLLLQAFGIPFYGKVVD